MDFSIYPAEMDMGSKSKKSSLAKKSTSQERSVYLPGKWSIPAPSGEGLRNEQLMEQIGYSDPFSRQNSYHRSSSKKDRNNHHRKYKKQQQQSSCDRLLYEEV